MNCFLTADCCGEGVIYLYYFIPDEQAGPSEEGFAINVARSGAEPYFGNVSFCPFCRKKLDYKPTGTAEKCDP